MGLFKIASNGAVVSTYNSKVSGPNTLVVAGQHGSEVGPIHAILGWQPHIRKGSLTVIRIANTFGAAMDCRNYQTFCGQKGDMNREWGIPQTLSSELWDIAMSNNPDKFDFVYDLHSSPSHKTGGMGLLVLAANKKHRKLADEIAGVLSKVELGWRGWDPSDPISYVSSFNGTLTGYAEQIGAKSVTIEFADNMPKEALIVGAVEGEEVSKFSNAPIRKRSIHERMIGVYTLLEWIVLQHGSEVQNKT